MKPFRWDPEKNDQLKQERGVSFEQVAVAVETGNLLQIAPHQNPAKYPRQKIMIVKIDDYAIEVVQVQDKMVKVVRMMLPAKPSSLHR